MFELLDDISELIYISDPKTYEVLYVNKSGKQTFGVDSWEGRKCYEIFQGRDCPCEFCTNHLLGNGETYTWEVRNPVSGRYYFLKDRFIDINGRLARMEVAFDMTDLMNEKQKLEEQMEVEQMVMQCIHVLYETRNIQNGINQMLRTLGEGLSAGRTYVFEIGDKYMSNTYEWCGSEVVSEIDELQQMDVKLMDRWISYFKRNECVIIKDMEEIKETSPEEYENLSMQNIKSLVAAPLIDEGRLMGMIGVDNPPASRIMNIAPLLTTLCYFMTVVMRRAKDEEKLQILSLKDTLTGLRNRNCYIRDLESITDHQGSLGVVYMDLNGLKEINDKSGHAEGDEALIYCADRLKEIFSEGLLYRIGGDEFVVLQTGMNKDEFYVKAELLRQKFQKNAPYHAAIGVQWGETAAAAEDMVQRADTGMYEDKRRFYREHVESSRYREFTDQKEETGGQDFSEDYILLMNSMRVSVSKHLMRDGFPVIWANRYFYEMTGYTEEEFEECFHGNCKKYFKQEEKTFRHLEKVIWEEFEKGSNGYRTELRLPKKNGKHIWIRLIGTFTNERVDGFPVVYTVFSDVDEVIRSQREQKMTYDNLPGFVAEMQIQEKEVKLITGNKKFNKFFGMNANDSTNERIRDAMIRNKEVIEQNYQRLRNGQPAAFQVTASGADGAESVFQINAGCIDWIGNDPVYLIMFLDITKTVEQNHQLSRLAFVDPVTDGMNKASFEIHAGNMVKNSSPRTYVLVSVDILKFKVINDLYGIEAGDRTLKYVYQKISEFLGEGEYAARISADTFNILMWADERTRVEARVKKLAEGVNNFNKNKDGKYLLAMAAGIYLIDEPDLPITHMQDRANVARKKIKTSAGSEYCVCYFYNHKDRNLLNREKDIENRMGDALKNGEFVVYLQPKQDLKQKNIAGAEALVRWQDPKNGLVPPGDFIPLFEKNGFIIELDLFVFEQVCILLRKWSDSGKPLVPISVNMSRSHLVHLDFLDKYEEIRRRYEVEAKWLEIEVTETMIFENPHLLENVIDEIRRCGYHCSMDDFGSGNSSLNVLKDIRVDTLKLDRAFFSEEEEGNSRELDIISIVIEMARRLSMTTVAEGVETQRQADFLQHVGCDILQGYLFSKPIPIAEFENLLFGTSSER